MVLSLPVSAPRLLKSSFSFTTVAKRLLMGALWVSVSWDSKKLPLKVLHSSVFSLSPSYYTYSYWQKGWGTRPTLLPFAFMKLPQIFPFCHNTHKPAGGGGTFKGVLPQRSVASEVHTRGSTLSIVPHCKSHSEETLMVDLVCRSLRAGLCACLCVCMKAMGNVL